MPYWGEIRIIGNTCVKLYASNGQPLCSSGRAGCYYSPNDRATTSTFCGTATDPIVFAIDASDSGWAPGSPQMSRIDVWLLNDSDPALDTGLFGGSTRATDFITIAVGVNAEDGEVGQPLATYVYSAPDWFLGPQGKSFLRPVVPQNLIPDLLVRVFPGGTVLASFDGSGEFPWNGPYSDYETTLGERYVANYHSAALASEGAPTHGMFIARLTPGARPTVDDMTFEMSPLLDAQIPSTWSTPWDDYPGLTLRFPAGRRLNIEGTLNADAVRLTAANPAHGWRGVRFAPGSGGSLSNVVVERVAGYGATALSVTNASPSFSSVVIEEPVASSAVTGLSVSGQAASVTATNLTVRDMTAGGIVLNDRATLRMETGSVTNNLGIGLSAGYQTTAFLYPPFTTAARTNGPVFTGNGGAGIRASSSASVVLGWGFQPPNGHHNDGFVQTRGNTAEGLFATTGAVVYAGGSQHHRRNVVHSNTGRDARANGTGSRIYARCNWWNDLTPPFRIQAQSGGTVDASQWLVGDPTQNPSVACVNNDSEADGRAAERGAAPGTMTPGEAMVVGATLADRLAAAVALAPEEAFAVLTGIVDEAPASLEAAVAVGEVARLLAGEAPPAGAGSWLADLAIGPLAQLRQAALAGYVSLRHRAGNLAGAHDAASALIAEGGQAAIEGHVARVYLYADAGLTGDAVSALAALEAVAPGSVEVELASAHLGLTDVRMVGPDAMTPETSQSTAGGRALDLHVAPNPANGDVTVSVQLGVPSAVRISLHDVLGREVAVLLSGSERAEGTHAVTLSTAALAPGAYLVRVATADAVRVARLTVAR